MLSKEIVIAIKGKVKNIAKILMDHEEKNFCLAQVHPSMWKHVSYEIDGYDSEFVIVPSITFNRFIFEQEYLNVVKQYCKCFGGQDDMLIVKALKEYDKPYLVREYTDEEYLDLISLEAMAYIFKVENKYSISDRILRLDLCRGINKSNIFQGGIFHALKHFSVRNCSTLSSNTKEYPIETWSDIYKYIILNFFLGDTEKDNRENCYISKCFLKDGHILRGVYYKEDNIPVAFLNSIRIDSSSKKDSF